MGHPLIDEFCRVKGYSSCRPEFFHRCQRVFREEVQPQLDELERLRQDNHALRNELHALKLKADARRKERQVEVNA